MDPSSSPPLPPRSQRKRPFDQLHDFTALSDGPMFSSDPPEPSIDSDRRKRSYAGPWWAHDDSTPKLPPTPARFSAKDEFVRNLDSGVFMPVDDSSGAKSSSAAVTRSSGSVRANPLPAAVSHAKAIIEHALDSYDPAVDLSGLSLQSLDGLPVAQLRTLVHPPKFLDAHSDPARSPHDNYFRPIDSHVEIYLANNSLRQLPVSLWSLDNLTVLSLRNNQLTSVPPSIARLANLVELNLANNCLRWLPWELKTLLGPGKKLDKFHVRPNPFLKPLELPAQPLELPSTMDTFDATDRSMHVDSQDYNSEMWMSKIISELHALVAASPDVAADTDPSTCLWQPLWSSSFVGSTVFVACSRLSWLQTDGSTIRDSPVPPSQLPTQVSVLPCPPPANCPITQLRRLCPSVVPSRVPSLLEVSMAACSVAHELPRLHQLLPKFTPVPVEKALAHTQNAVAEGGRFCTVCHRQYLIPRAEWIEYWYLVAHAANSVNPAEFTLPFLRQSCSWRCLPQVV